MVSRLFAQLHGDAAMLVVVMSGDLCIAAGRTGVASAPKRRLKGKQPAAAVYKGNLASSSVRVQSALSCVATPPVPASAASQWSRLERIMAWQAKGLLTEQEFANAKQMLGL